MWIVLLDHSGSMGDPFEQSGASSRRARMVDAETKLEAAKAVLKEEVAELKETDPDLKLVIFAFTDRAVQVYDGPVADLEAIVRALERLRPRNGTDIAAALNAAADYKEANKDSILAQLVLISDGKSDRVKAMAAARQCLERQLALSMLLIDPTQEGLAFAREVVRAVGGTYQTVLSRQDLRKATKDVSESYAAQQARADNYFAAAKLEAQDIREAVADREQVIFTAGYPGRIVPGSDYLVRVYLHLQADLQEIVTRLEQVTAQFGAYPRRADSEPNQRIPIGTNLEVTPRINWVRTVPAQQQVTWTGAIEELSFRIRYAGPEQAPVPCSGFIDISTCGLVVAQIPISIQVKTGEVQIAPQTVGMISRVFASYSHQDEPVVRACKAAYRALGIQLFIDKDDILSGELWRGVLRRSIADHDLFQLFWSQTAADSNEVANEWKLAKEIAPARTTDFIRPLYWTEPMPAVPEALQDMHFARLDLTSLQLPSGKAEGGEAPPASPATQQVRLEASFPILETVDPGPGWMPQLQEQIGLAVPFLENLIGIRYFPPATFIVEQHMIVAARQVLTTDAPDRPGDAPSPSKDSLEPALEILQALALGFHVGKLADPDMAFDQRAAYFEVYGGEARADYDHVTRMAEYVFSGPVKDYFAGNDVLAHVRISLKQTLEAVTAGRWGFHAADMVQQTLDKANPIERDVLSGIVTADTIKELGSYEESARGATAARLLESPLPRLAEQYQIFDFFGELTQHTLRNHHTFPEYIGDLIQHWRRYIETAMSKRPNSVISVGFAISQPALRWAEHTFGDIELRVTRSDNGRRETGPQYYFDMTIEDYGRCVDRLSALLLAELPEAPPDRLAVLVTAAVSTHGIYMPASDKRAQAQLVRSLAQQGWPEQAALNGQHKILLCMSALDRFRSELEARNDKKEAEDLTRTFGLSVLIHEHFHAAVATGLDRYGKPAMGAENSGRWQSAAPLNESLAVWCERHFFRSDPRMLELIDRYIGSGTYPAWPYRGAEIIESFYLAEGTPAIRKWINHLRDDPENAQRSFDRKFSGA
jgi:hypothetical protein